jgi:hypothetical protein
VSIEPIGRFTRPLLEESRRRDFGPLASDFGISGDVAFGSALRTGARYEGVLATVGARVGFVAAKRALAGAHCTVQMGRLWSVTGSMRFI